MNQIVNRLTWAVDLLLPCSMALFLLPFDPRLSTLPIAIWLIIQLMVADRAARLLQWSWLALLLFSVREWWFNHPPHPASIIDGLLLISGIICASTVSPERWNRLLVLPTLGFLPLLFTFSSKPWTPNPFVGSNQAAYLFGLFFSIILIWLFAKLQRSRWLLAVSPFPLLLFIFLWQTGSRAALISALVACLVVFVAHQIKNKNFWKRVGFISIMLTIAYLMRAILSSNSSLPGLKAGSDLGRLMAYECFAALPFTGNNRLIYGVGFDRVGELCKVEFQGLTLDHAHNLYLQIWASTGILGVIGILLTVLLVLQQYTCVQELMSEPIRLCWQAASVYVLAQGFFDASLLHWPVILIYIGVLVGIPYSFRLPTSERSLNL